MAFARVSFGCVLVAIAIVFATDMGSDWSRPLGILWYGLVAVAVVSALIGFGFAAFARSESGRRRLVMAILSLPALLSVAALLQLLLMLSQDTS